MDCTTCLKVSGDSYVMKLAAEEVAGVADEEADDALVTNAIDRTHSEVI